MKILIFTFGTRGDVQPYIALGCALRDLGHTVTLSTSPGFAAEAATHAIGYAPISIDYRNLIERSGDGRSLATIRGKLDAWRTFAPLFKTQLDDMWSVARCIRPDVIVYHPKAFAAQAMAMALKVVAIPTTLMPLFVSSAAFPHPFVTRRNLGSLPNRATHTLMNRLIAAGQTHALRGWLATTPLFGGGKLPELSFASGYRPDELEVPFLHGYSRHLTGTPSNWPARYAVTGAWRLASVPWVPPPALSAFLEAGSPPVYVGFGSMPLARSLKLGKTVLEALALARQRAIVAKGWGLDEDIEQTANTYVIEEAPHEWLFPRCCAIVHHGGAGTTHAAVTAGRPSVICPMIGDQPYWGHRVHTLGAAPQPIPVGRLSAPRLASALRAAAEPRVMKAAEHLALLLRGESGEQGAAKLITTALKAESAPC